jgi:RNA recognition motif-containing protein
VRVQSCLIVSVIAFDFVFADCPVRCRLCVSHLISAVAEDEFLKLFLQFGDIQDAVSCPAHARYFQIARNDLNLTVWPSLAFALFDCLLPVCVCVCMCIVLFVGQVIMRDKHTGVSRGFGFVTYADAAAAERVLRSPTPLELCGRKLDCKFAVPKHLIGDSLNPDLHRTKKLFVGGLASDLTTEQFRAYFEHFGKIQDCVIMMVRLGPHTHAPAHAHTHTRALTHTHSRLIAVSVLLPLCVCGECTGQRYRPLAWFWIHYFWSVRSDETPPALRFIAMGPVL